MKKSIYLAVICFLSIFNYAYSLGNNKDSLLTIINSKSNDTIIVNALIKLSEYYLSLPNDKECEKYAKKADSLSQAIKYDRGRAIALAILGGVYSGYDINKSIKYTLWSNSILKEINDTLRNCYSLNLLNLSYYYLDNGLLDKSYDLQIRRLNLSKLTNKINYQIDSYCNLGQINTKRGEYQNALKNYNEAYKIAIKNDSVNYMNDIYFGIAETYTMFDYKKAINYYFKSLKPYYNKYQNDYFYGYLNLSNVYRLLGDYKNSSLYIDSASKYINNDYDKFNYLNSLGNLNVSKKLYNEAYENFYTSLRITKNLGSKKFIVTYYENLYKLDSITNNLKDYISNFRLYTVYKDSLNNVESEKKIIAMEMNVNFEKEKSIMKAEQDNIKKLSEVNRKRQRDIIIGIGIILFIVIIVSGIIYKGYIKQNKANKIISYQKHLVDEKQKEILDNITYAKRIQTSIIPTNEYISKYAKNSFVMYNPKDIVSGDFYWATEKENKFYLATADCTGHGVSGAMVSMLNSSILNEVINQNNITNTGEILNEVRNRVIKSLNPNGNEGVNDGMDCVLCAFDFDKKTLQYSASNNSFYIVRNNELIVCKADKMPIGLSTRMDSFTTNEIQLQDNDVVYMFTDGYADQFGGEQNKKFKYKQLEQLLLSIQDFTMATQKRLLIERFNEWKGNNEQTDDVLVIGVKI